jgi:hypothetical protein
MFVEIPPHIAVSDVVRRVEMERIKMKYGLDTGEG